MTTPNESRPALQPLSKRLKPLKEYPLKRCLNCPKFFRQTRAWSKFCGLKCRRAWQTNNTAYAQLKHKFTQLIEEASYEHAKARFDSERVALVEELRGIVKSIIGEQIVASAIGEEVRAAIARRRVKSKGRKPNAAKSARRSKPRRR
jgi:hypothetical protein